MTGGSGGGWGCPLPESRYGRVTMAHGGGGTLTDRLLHGALGALLPKGKGALGDAAWVDCGHGVRVAVTTDGFVVRPMEFPGGDIATLAVNGTVNDLAVAGARPVAITAGWVLEEGVDMAVVERLAGRMRAAADAAGVDIAAGDTKVVERGAGEPGAILNTTGIGVLAEGLAEPPRPERIREGDAVIATGSIGRHGVAVMASRTGLSFEGLTSDCAPLAEAMLDLYRSGIDVHCARDATRSGLGGILCELSRDRGLGMLCQEERIPVHGDVRAACELMGLDPLFVANEGCAAVFVPKGQADAALEALRRHEACREAARIGSVTGEDVRMATELGTVRRIYPPSGELLPRIC